MKHVRLALFSILLGLARHGIAEACSYAPFTGYTAGDAIVVTGTIAADVEAGVVSPWGQYSSRVIVEKVWFGPDQREYRLIAPPVDPGMCGGVAFVGKPGERVIAWLRPFGNNYYQGHAIAWDDEKRQAAEADLRKALARYDDVDRRLRAKPDDPELWRARLKIATDIRDVHGKLRSLKRLIDLTPRPDFDLLKNAALTANELREDDALVRYADRALLLDSSDKLERKWLEKLRQEAPLRRRYDKEGLVAMGVPERGAWNVLIGAVWAGQRDDDARLERLRLMEFQIKRSTFGGLIDRSDLSGGAIHDTSFKGMTIRDSKLDGVLMRNVTLSGATLSKVKIIGGRFVDTTFRDATMTDVWFLAELDKVDFRRARLTNVKFAGELTDVVFDGASLEQVGFYGTRLRNVDLSRVADVSLKNLTIDCSTKLPAGTDPIKSAIVFDTRLCNGQPNNRDFTSASYATRHDWHGLELTDAVFTGVSLDGPEFAGSVLYRANFNGASIRWLGANSADLRDARFKDAKIGAGDFRFADLRGADFSGASFSVQDFGDSPFRGAKYDLRTIWPATIVDRQRPGQPFDPAAYGAILVKD